MNRKHEKKEKIEDEGVGITEIDLIKKKKMQKMREDDDTIGRVLRTEGDDKEECGYMKNDGGKDGG